METKIEIINKSDCTGCLMRCEANKDCCAGCIKICAGRWACPLFTYFLTVAEKKERKYNDKSQHCIKEKIKQLSNKILYENNKEAAQSNEENPVILTQGYKLTAYISFQAGVAFAQQWISVKDELPEERVSILIKRNNKMLVVGYYIEEHDAFYCPHILYNVTHWRYIELK